MSKAKKRCRHVGHIKVHDWYHQSMGESAEARWCQSCGALRRNWERRWMKPEQRKAKS